MDIQVRLIDVTLSRSRVQPPRSTFASVGIQKSWVGLVGAAVAAKVKLVVAVELERDLFVLQVSFEPRESNPKPGFSSAKVAHLHERSVVRRAPL